MQNFGSFWGVILEDDEELHVGVYRPEDTHKNKLLKAFSFFKSSKYQPIYKIHTKNI